MLERYDDVEVFIAERLAKLRQQKNISARDMSFSLGHGHGYINHIENQKAMPSIQGLCEICEFFNISIKEFFDDDTEEPVLINRIVKEIKKLDAKALEKLLEFIESIN